MTAIAYPFHFDDTGRVASVRTEVAEARQKLTLLVTTLVSERVMRPTYGMGLQEVVFEPNGDLLLAQVDQMVRRSVEKFLPEMSIVQVKASRPEPHIVMLDVAFRLLTDIDREDVYTVTVTAGGTAKEEVF